MNNLLVPRKIYRKTSYSKTMKDYDFEINGQIVYFVEDAHTHRVHVFWDDGDVWLSKGKALAIINWLEMFMKEIEQ